MDPVASMPAAASSPAISSSPAPDGALRYLQQFCALLVFAFPATALVADDFATTLFFVLALIGLVAAFYPSARAPVPREIKLLFFAVVVFFAVALLAYVLVDGSESGFKRLGRYARFLLLIPLYFVLQRVKPAPQSLWYGIAAGAIVAGLAAMDQRWWHLWYAEDGRASGSVHPIIFGDMALLLAALSVAGTGFFLQRGRVFLLVPVLAAVFGVLASFLSGSRGGWLALPALLLIFLWYARRHLKPWQYLLIGIAFVVGAVAVYQLPQTGVSARVDEATREISNYLDHGAANTSVGARLEMWKAAWMIFREHPVIGVGMGGFAREKLELIDHGELDASIAPFNHPHNEYLAALATRGLIGFASLLLLFGVAAKAFVDIGRRGPQAAAHRLAGIVVVVCFAHFGLSGDTFDRALPISFFAFLLAGLATLTPAAATLGQRRARRLSVIVITKNEADRLDACLQSVSGWADEIIVLDSGSSDATVAIARRYTERVEVTDWPGFGPQKQRALDRASGEWILSIDADERVTPELRNEIDGVLASDRDHIAYRIPWQVQSFGKTLDFGRSGRAPLRLFRREGARFSPAQVHEHVILPPGPVGRLHARLIHDSHRDFHHALEKFDTYAWLWAKERHGRGESGTVIGATAHAAWMFLAIYFFRLGMLDGKRGLMMAILFAQYTFNKHAALWSLHHQPRASAAEAPAEND